MRKKIEELRNREEGFTLVELLAVIVILAIIVAIAIPAIGSVMDRASSGATASEQALVEDAARLYITTDESADVVWNSGTDPNTETANIDVDDLYDGGFLEDRDGEGLAGNVEVTREETDTGSGIYKYEYDASGVTKKE